MINRNTFEGTAFLIAELIFCLAFISVCEVPNWAFGPRSANQCVDRWMFAAGLFTPSGLQYSTQPGSRTGRSKQE
jgi:hypothetical protein